MKIDRSDYSLYQFENERISFEYATGHVESGKTVRMCLLALSRVFGLNPLNNYYSLM